MYASVSNFYFITVLLLSSLITLEIRLRVRGFEFDLKLIPGWVQIN